MKRKYFLTQVQIRQIVKYYGGFRKYHYNPNVTSEYNSIYLCQKSNKYLWLSINNNYNNELTEVTLTNDTGMIIQRDYWYDNNNILDKERVKMKATNSLTNEKSMEKVIELYESATGYSVLVNAEFIKHDFSPEMSYENGKLYIWMEDQETCEDISINADINDIRDITFDKIGNTTVVSNIKLKNNDVISLHYLDEEDLFCNFDIAI